MRLIPLTRGQFATVDDDDYESLAEHNWHALKQPNTYYAARSVKSDGKKITIWMHRQVNGTPPDLLTDHINGDGLDNRKENLRCASHQDNMINCGRHKSCISIYRGVSWHISNRRWIAQITVDYRNIYIGGFSSEEEAHIAYESRRRELRVGKVMREERTVP